MDINQSVLPNAVLTYAAPSPALEPTPGIAPAAGTAGQSRSDSSTSEQAKHAQQPIAVEAVEVVEEINNNLRALATNLRFDMDPEIQRLVVSVVDAQSGEVLRTVPNEVMLHLAKMMVKLQGQVVSAEA